MLGACRAHDLVVFLEGTAGLTPARDDLQSDVGPEQHVLGDSDVTPCRIGNASELREPLRDVDEVAFQCVERLPVDLDQSVERSQVTVDGPRRVDRGGSVRSRDARAWSD